jgi:hypothetical protein
VIAPSALFSKISLRMGKRGEGVTWGIRHDIPGSFPGCFLSPKKANVIDALVCAMKRGRTWVFQTIIAPLRRRQHDIIKQSQPLALALKAAVEGRPVGLKTPEDQATFRKIFSEIVFEAFRLEVLFATDEASTIQVLGQLRDANNQSKMTRKWGGKQKNNKVGLLDLTTCVWGGLGVDPTGQEQHDAAMASVKEAEKKAVESKAKAEDAEAKKKLILDEINKMSKEKKAAAKAAKKVKKEEEQETKSSQKTRPKPAPLSATYTTVSSSRGRGITRSSCAVKSSSAPPDATLPPPPPSSARSNATTTLSSAMDDDDDEGTATAPLFAAAMDLDGTTTAPSTSRLNVPFLPLSSPRLTESVPPRTSPRIHINTDGPGLSPGKPPGRMGVTAVKILSRFRLDGLNPESLLRVAEVLKCVHHNASVEAPVTSEVANQILLACLKGLFPKFSLSTEDGKSSKLYQFFMDCSYTNRPSANGELPVTSTDAVNQVSSNPLPGQLPGENLRQRTFRVPGDNPSLLYDARRMMNALLLHGSEPKFKLRIINTVMQWLKIRISEYLISHPRTDEKTRALYFSVMNSKPARKAIALDVYDRFAHRSVAGKEKNSVWKDEEASASVKTLKKTVAAFVATFDLSVFHNFLKQYWDSMDLEENQVMDDAAPVRIPRGPRKNYAEVEDNDMEGRDEEDGPVVVEDDNIEDEWNLDEEDEEEEEVNFDDPDAAAANDEELKAMSSTKGFKSLFAKTRSPKYTNSSAAMWAGLHLNAAMMQLRTSWLNNARANGAWTPSNNVAEKLARTFERGGGVEIPLQTKDCEEDDDDNTTVPVNPPTLLQKDVHDACVRASFSCIRLFNLIPQCAQRSRSIQLSDNIMRNLLAGENEDILRELDAIVVQLRREMTAKAIRDNSEALRRRLNEGHGPNLMDALFYMPQQVDGKAHRGYEKWRMAEVDFDCVSISAKFKKRMKDKRDLSLKIQAFAQSTKARPFPEFAPPATVSETAKREDEDAKKSKQDAIELEEELKKATEEEATTQALSAQATANLTMFEDNNMKICNCVGACGQDCPCWGGQSNCIGIRCGCIGHQCGNRFKRYPANNDIDCNFCQQQGTGGGCFECEDCNRWFHVQCFASDVNNPTRCRPCQTRSHRDVLLALEKTAVSAATAASKNVTRLERKKKEEIAKKSTMAKKPAASPPSSGQPSSGPNPPPPPPPPPPPTVDSPSQHHLALFHMLVVDIQYRNGAYGYGSEVKLHDDNTLSTMLMHAGRIGKADETGSVILNELRKIDSVTFRVGVNGHKKAHSDKLRQQSTSMANSKP